MVKYILYTPHHLEAVRRFRSGLGFGDGEKERTEWPLGNGETWDCKTPADFKANPDGTVQRRMGPYEKDCLPEHIPGTFEFVYGAGLEICWNKNTTSKKMVRIELVKRIDCPVEPKTKYMKWEKLSPQQRRNRMETIPPETFNLWAWIDGGPDSLVKSILERLSPDEIFSLVERFTLFEQDSLVTELIKAQGRLFQANLDEVAARTRDLDGRMNTLEGVQRENYERLGNMVRDNVRRLKNLEDRYEIGLAQQIEQRLEQRPQQLDGHLETILNDRLNEMAEEIKAALRLEFESKLETLRRDNEQRLQSLRQENEQRLEAFRRQNAANFQDDESLYEEEYDDDGAHPSFDDDDDVPPRTVVHDDAIFQPLDGDEEEEEEESIGRIVEKSTITPSDSGEKTDTRAFETHFESNEKKSDPVDKTDSEKKSGTGENTGARRALDGKKPEPTLKSDTTRHVVETSGTPHEHLVSPQLVVQHDDSFFPPGDDDDDVVLPPGSNGDEEKGATVEIPSECNDKKSGTVEKTDAFRALETRLKSDEYKSEPAEKSGIAHHAFSNSLATSPQKGELSTPNTVERAEVSGEDSMKLRDETSGDAATKESALESTEQPKKMIDVCGSPLATSHATVHTLGRTPETKRGAEKKSAPSPPSLEITPQNQKSEKSFALSANNTGPSETRFGHHVSAMDEQTDCRVSLGNTPLDKPALVAERSGIFEEIYTNETMEDETRSAAAEPVALGSGPIGSTAIAPSQSEKQPAKEIRRSQSASVVLGPGLTSADDDKENRKNNGNLREQTMQPVSPAQKEVFHTLSAHPAAESVVVPTVEFSMLPPVERGSYDDAKKKRNGGNFFDPVNEADFSEYPLSFHPTVKSAVKSAVESSADTAKNDVAAAQEKERTDEKEHDDPMKIDESFPAVEESSSYYPSLVTAVVPAVGGKMHGTDKENGANTGNLSLLYSSDVSSLSLHEKKSLDESPLRLACSETRQDEADLNHCYELVLLNALVDDVFRKESERRLLSKVGGDDSADLWLLLSSMGAQDPFPGDVTCSITKRRLKLTVVFWLMEHRKLAVTIIMWTFYIMLRRYGRPKQKPGRADTRPRKVTFNEDAIQVRLVQNRAWRAQPTSFFRALFGLPRETFFDENEASKIQTTRDCIHISNCAFLQSMRYPYGRYYLGRLPQGAGSRVGIVQEVICLHGYTNKWGFPVKDPFLEKGKLCLGKTVPFHDGRSVTFIPVLGRPTRVPALCKPTLILVDWYANDKHQITMATVLDRRRLEAHAGLQRAWQAGQAVPLRFFWSEGRPVSVNRSHLIRQTIDDGHSAEQASIRHGALVKVAFRFHDDSNHLTWFNALVLGPSASI